MSKFHLIPNSWNWVNLGNISEVITGNTPPTSDVKNYGGGIPFFKPPQLNDTPVSHAPETLSEYGIKKARILPPKSVLVSCIGILGKTAITTNLSATNQQINAVVFDKFINPEYGFYFLQTLGSWLKANSSATTVAIINKSKFETAPFPLPPFYEQTRIVAKLEELLSDLDAGVAELKAAQKKLAQYRQSLLKAAVSGTLTADWRSQHPATETGAQLLERILQQRRARWEAKQLAKFQEQGKTPPKDWEKKYPEPVQPDTAGLPALPPGWVWASGEQLCEFITKGTTPPKESASSVQKTIPFLRVTNLTDRGELDLADKVFISAEIHRGFLARSVVYPNDVLMNIVGPPLGQVAVVPSKFSEWNINQAIAIFRAVDGVFPWFICHYLLSPLAQQWLKARSKTTAGQTNLTLEVCRSLPFPLPPQNEQEALLLHIDMALSSIVNQQKSIALALQQSTAQRQNILRAAFSGQLVPQDPNDEPASVLLERIRAERAAQTAVKKPRGRKAQTAKEACDEN
ncbi:MAG: restriction endonuclease subunit S [Giesbergeria sp.]|uniref:restriction endonuclease subunit S n=1 Tax=Giesbergeria sp. TaxID=2818473 RepID=UPI0026174126|nr:restriction endonuclease subunit S [Giesbergeria sp.]MDD2609699.1 restriction endonuclease subunit S [Giesbergeria sp.]